MGEGTYHTQALEFDPSEIQIIKLLAMYHKVSTLKVIKE